MLQVEVSKGKAENKETCAEVPHLEASADATYLPRIISARGAHIVDIFVAMHNARKTRERGRLCVWVRAH